MEAPAPPRVSCGRSSDLSPIDRGQGTLVRCSVAALSPHRIGKRSVGEKILA